MPHLTDLSRDLVLALLPLVIRYRVDAHKADNPVERV